MINAALQYAARQHASHLEELFAFLRLPSVSTDPAYAAPTAAAADWLAERLAAAGLENVRVIPTARPPLVYADWLHAGPGALTVLI